MFSVFTNFNIITTLGYLVFSVSWLAFAYFFGRLIPDQQLWFALLVTLVFGLPIYFAAIYAVTIQRIYLSSQFKKPGILHWLFTRRILAYIWWLLWSVIFAFLLLFYLGSADKQEWLAFFATIPAFAIVYAVFFPLAAREYKPYIAVHKSLSWSRWVTSFLMALIFVVFINHSDVNHQYASLTEAVATESKKLDGTTNSILILETNRLLGFIEGVKSFALSSLYSRSNMLYVGAVYLGSLVFFFNLALGVSSFMVPLSEYRRVFAPIQDSDSPPAVSPWAWGITSAFATFFVFFIYVPSTVYVDAWMRSNPETMEELRTSQQAVIQSVEKIGDDYYKPGTAEQIELAYLESLYKLETSINQLRKTADLGFKQMTDNVDNYLDWYYSLPGEYERIVALATGVLENWMTEKLQSYLMKGNAFGPVQQSIEEVLHNNLQLRAEHLQKVERILIKNRVDHIDNSQLEIVRQASLSALKEPPTHSVIVNLENRMLISGGIGTAGAITGAIAGKITAKVAGKGIIKLGAQALIKVTAGKAVSALGGAAAGAATGMAFGSFIPGIGTAIGAAIGGIIGGITIGLTVEKLLLMLEEAFSREEFKHQILEAIEEERIEFEKFLSTPALLDEISDDMIEVQAP
ncbi:hypothetical protein [Nitrosomonas supralitoralis]|uniref:Uncharacterized protein n=1 Tax=Nitrosomonas supralitoralis TaxID=2116706 RepID=A0A2P7NWM6_9PROT|nr:hypothetical protein [Nitrosomonas supralitoralis]PSJ17858.1 hypothetical protein C7H79_05600 [Nitrosomonas supralitoralis]